MNAEGGSRTADMIREAYAVRMLVAWIMAGIGYDGRGEGLLHAAVGTGDGGLNSAP
jgi:hypothetical protein